MSQCFSAAQRRARLMVWDTVNHRSSRLLCVLAIHEDREGALAAGQNETYLIPMPPRRATPLHRVLLLSLDLCFQHVKLTFRLKALSTVSPFHQPLLSPKASLIQSSHPPTPELPLECKAFHGVIHYSVQAFCPPSLRFRLF